MKRLFLLLLALLATGLIAAGCGDDDDDNGGGDDSPPAAQTQEPDAGAGDTGGDDADSGDVPASADAAVQAAVDSCKQSIDAQPQLSDDVKTDLQEICEEAASGDEDAVRQATRDVCVKIVEETAPEGPARDQAVSACDQATQTP